MADSDFRPAREDIDALLDGPGLAFEVDGVTFYIAAPTGEELDEASFIADLARERTLAMPEARELKDTPSDAPEIFASKADELASRRAAMIRDRWLVARLLRDADGEPLFDPNDEVSAREFQSAKWQRVKDAARPVVWRVLGIIRTVPFGSESGSASD